MRSAKVVNQILVGSIAFGASFVLGLMQNRDLNKALLTGGITGFVTFVGAAMVDNRRTQHQLLLTASLEDDIQELEVEETHLWQSLHAASMKKQQVEASINALQSERSRLLIRVAELHHQRNILHQELTRFQRQRQQQEEEFQILQSQVQQFEKQQTELSQSLSAKIFQIQQTETHLNRLLEEYQHLQSQHSGQPNQQVQINQDLTTLESHKQHLGGEVYDLQTQIKVLEQRREELNQSLLSLQLQKASIETNLTSEQAGLKALQKQVSQNQKQQKNLIQDITTLEGRKQQLEADYRILQTQVRSLEKQKTKWLHAPTEDFAGDIARVLPQEWCEWLEFVQQLSDDERKALKAILEQDEAALKKIADKTSTMPQVLIDAINNRALETFGDTLFVSNGNLTVPEVHEEYSSIFVEPIEVYFKDLLDFTEKRNVSHSSQLPRSR